MDVEFVPSVLLIVEPDAPSQPCLGRALMLARYLHARLDIICPESGPAGSPAQARRRLEEKRQYMAALLQSIAVTDVDITIDTVPVPLAALIAAKAREKRAALVVKAPWNRLGSDPLDWQLMRNCPVPMLLTDGRPWHPRARMLAAVKAGAAAGAKNAAVLEAATTLQHACSAELELVSVDTRQASTGAAATGALDELERLKTRFHLGQARTHLLKGADAAATLREFTDRQACDVLIVGAPTRRLPSPCPRPRSVAQMLTGVGCDLLCVQDPERGLHEVVDERRQRRFRAVPLWQWIGAD